MYALASEIERGSDEAGLSKAASRVVQILACVIDKPIAPAEQLDEARRRFNILLNYLVLIVDRELRDKPLMVPNDKPMKVTRARIIDAAGNGIGKDRQGRRPVCARNARRKVSDRQW